MLRKIILKIRRIIESYKYYMYVTNKWLGRAPYKLTTGTILYLPWKLEQHARERKHFTKRKFRVYTVS